MNYNQCNGRMNINDQKIFFICFYSSREREKLTYEIADLKQRAMDITFLKVTRNVQEYLACSNDSEFEAQKQRELQMFESTIEKMKQVYLFLYILH